MSDELELPADVLAKIDDEVERFRLMRTAVERRKHARRLAAEAAKKLRAATTRPLAELKAERKARRLAMLEVREQQGLTFKKIGEMFGVGSQRARECVLEEQWIRNYEQEYGKR